MTKYLLLLIIAQSIFANTAFPSDFKTVMGEKANYSLEIPLSFKETEAIGKNIDLNFKDDKGNSINTLILDFNSYASKITLDDMNELPDAYFKEDMEALGMRDVNVIKRGIRYVNAKKAYYVQFTSSLYSQGYKSTQYYQSVTLQISGNKFLQVSFSCDYNNKDYYLPFIYRVMSSIKLL